MFRLEGLKTYIAAFLVACWGIAFLFEVIDNEAFLGGLAVLFGILGITFRKAIEKIEYGDDEE